MRDDPYSPESMRQRFNAEAERSRNLGNVFMPDWDEMRPEDQEHFIAYCRRKDEEAASGRDAEATAPDQDAE